MTTPESTYCDSSVTSMVERSAVRASALRAAAPLRRDPTPRRAAGGAQRPGPGTHSPVLNSGGKAIFASAKDCSGLVYCVMSMGGVHCCQYGPSPRVKLIVPFHPSNLLVRRA